MNTQNSVPKEDLLYFRMFCLVITLLFLAIIFRMFGAELGEISDIFTIGLLVYLVSREREDKMSSKGVMEWSSKDFPFENITLKLSANDILALFTEMFEKERRDILHEIISNLPTEEFYNLKSWMNEE